MPTKVLIGIQARSGSTRLPRKAYAKIGNVNLLSHVIDVCQSSADYLNWRTNYNNLTVQVALLVPFDDPIANDFAEQAAILEGPEHDVLARYYKALERFTPDYVVRVTGDCPLLPDYVITKHITTAAKCRYDYLSNVDEETRTAMDGHDCEVMSARMLAWLHGAAEDPRDREHVTLMARREPAADFSMGCIINYHDHSHLKFSVDTAEDLERARAEHRRWDEKMTRAEAKFGRARVHRL